MRKALRLLRRVLGDSCYIWAYQRMRLDTRTVLFYTQRMPQPEMMAFLNRAQEGILCARGAQNAKEYGNVQAVHHGGLRCKKALARAGVIFADTPLPKYYIKKSGQVLVAFRHTMPDEPAGRQACSRAYAMGHEQRNLLCADVLIFPDEQVRKAYFQAYLLDGLYRGRVVISDAPAQVLERLKNYGAAACGAEYVCNGRANVLIYSGALVKNGMTSALLALLSRLDLSGRNYYLSFKEESLAAEPERLARIPAQAGLIPVYDPVRYTLRELFFYVLYFKCNYAGKSTRRVVNGLYRREFQRFYGNLPIDKAIHFTGYDGSAVKLFEFFQDNTIFVHNDMVREIQTKHELNMDLYRQAYKRYRRVAVVSEDILAPTMQIGAQKEKLVVIPNLILAEEIRQKARQPVAFDADTDCTVSQRELETLLASNTKVIVTVGRFSPEKGHLRLIEAFEQFSRQHRDYALLIIGGYGNFFSQTLTRAQQSSLKSRIVILRSIGNPMPVVKQCDVFVLPSYYEALGLVMLEADILGLPVFATNVRGPRGFLQKHGGVLVEDSTQGIVSGLERFARGEISKLCVDYEAENTQALAALEHLLEEHLER